MLDIGLNYRKIWVVVYCYMQKSSLTCAENPGSELPAGWFLVGSPSLVPVILSYSRHCQSTTSGQEAPPLDATGSLDPHSHDSLWPLLHSSNKDDRTWMARKVARGTPKNFRSQHSPQLKKQGFAQSSPPRIPLMRLLTPADRPNPRRRAERNRQLPCNAVRM